MLHFTYVESYELQKYLHKWIKRLYERCCKNILTIEILFPQDLGSIVSKLSNYFLYPPFCFLLKKPLYKHHHLCVPNLTKNNNNFLVSNGFIVAIKKKSQNKHVTQLTSIWRLLKYTIFKAFPLKYGLFKCKNVIISS